MTKTYEEKLHDILVTFDADRLYSKSNVKSANERYAKAMKAIDQLVTEARLDELLTNVAGKGYTRKEVELMIDAGLLKSVTNDRIRELQAKLKASEESNG